jgi:hypothetical protein
MLHAVYRILSTAVLDQQESNETRAKVKAKPKPKATAEPAVASSKTVVKSKAEILDHRIGLNNPYFHWGENCHDSLDVGFMCERWFSPMISRSITFPSMTVVNIAVAAPAVSLPS